MHNTLWMIGVAFLTPENKFFRGSEVALPKPYGSSSQANTHGPESRICFPYPRFGRGRYHGTPYPIRLSSQELARQVSPNSANNPSRLDSLSKLDRAAEGSLKDHGTSDRPE